MTEAPEITIADYSVKSLSIGSDLNVVLASVDREGNVSINMEMIRRFADMEMGANSLTPFAKILLAVYNLGVQSQ